MRIDISPFIYTSSFSATQSDYVDEMDVSRQPHSPYEANGANATLDPVDRPVGRRVFDRTRKFLAHFPWYTCASLVVYTVFFGVQRTYGEHVKQVLRENLQFDTDLREDPAEIWRYYTHSLLHANPTHYALNAVCLLILSSLLEVVHGFTRTFVVTSMCILHGASGIAWENRLTGEHVVGIGASGGMYGIIGAHGGDLFVNWNRINWRWVRLGIFLAYLLCDTIAWYYAYDEDISYSGHLGGFLAGLLGGPVMLATRDQLFPSRRHGRRLSREEKEKEKVEHIEIVQSSPDDPTEHRETTEDREERTGEKRPSMSLGSSSSPPPSPLPSLLTSSSSSRLPWATYAAWSSGAVFFLYTFFGALNAFGGI